MISGVGWWGICICGETVGHGMTWHGMVGHDSRSLKWTEGEGRARIQECTADGASQSRPRRRTVGTGKERNGTGCTRWDVCMRRAECTSGRTSRRAAEPSRAGWLPMRCDAMRHAPLHVGSSEETSAVCCACLSAYVCLPPASSPSLQPRRSIAYGSSHVTGRC